MPYLNFQLIALETPTLNATNPAKMWPKDALANVQDPDLKGFSQDARDRFNWLLGGLEEAKVHKDLDPSTNTLKIFIAPEFFFRPLDAFDKQRDERFYDFNTAIVIEKLFSVVFGDESLKHWLIIPGTMVRGDQANNLKTPNRVYAVQGGVGPNNAILTVHEKFNNSDADKIPDKSQKNVFAPKLKKGATRKDLLKNQVASLKDAQTNIFMVGGHRIGIDVCLDHKYGVLRQTCQTYHCHNNEVTGVDLQLLVACGMDISHPGVATCKDGFILRVDGSSAFDPYSNLALVKKQDWEDYDAVDFAKLDKAVKDSKLRAYQPGGDDKYSERLTVYEATAFPK